MVIHEEEVTVAFNSKISSTLVWFVLSGRVRVDETTPGTTERRSTVGFVF